MRNQTYRITFAGLPLLLLAAGSPQAAVSEDAVVDMSMVDIRHSLHYAPDDVRYLPALEKHAADGDRRAAFLLANHLSRSGNFNELARAADLYEVAFASGDGDISALVELATLSNRFPSMRASGHERIKRLSQDLGFESDFKTVETRLQLFLVYPDTTEPGKVEHLLDLYRTACIEDCRTLTLEARLLEVQGQRDAALEKYTQALSAEPLAVDLYFDLLGAEVKERFVTFADAHKDDAAIWHVGSVTSIGTKLSVLADTDPTLSAYWLDAAIDRGSLQATIARVNLMMSFPDRYGPEDTLSLIENIRVQSPIDGRRLFAAAHLVRNWKILNPILAGDMLQQAIAEGDTEAYMGLGELYSMGGLNEADQDMALAAYGKLAQRGHGAAHYRIATIYEGGRSICHDSVKAHAHAQLAMELGQPNAEGLLNRVQAKLNADELAAAKALAQTLRNDNRKVP